MSVRYCIFDDWHFFLAGGLLLLNLSYRLRRRLLPLPPFAKGFTWLPNLS